MGRSIRKTTTVAAPPDVVWHALTDAEELTRWFPTSARVTPGAGGSIWISWGPGAEGQAPITAWEPGRHLQWTEDRGAVKIVVDFHLEPAEHGTIVRLVQSGFGDGPEWDDEFHMTDGGWTYFLAHLRWYLERHRGIPRDVIAVREALPLSRAAAFERLVGSLSADGALLEAQAGDRYATETRDGRRLSGLVVASNRSTGQLGATIAELNDGLVLVEMEPHADGVRAAIWLSTYGLDADRLAEARAWIESLYRSALAAAATR